MTLPHSHLGTGVDRIVAHHIHKLPGARREDAIKVYVTRDGSLYFRNEHVYYDDLSDKIRDAVRNGAEKRIYLEVDARAHYDDLNAILPQIQKSGIENVSFIADSPSPSAPLSFLPTR